ncbi:isochorismatase family protein [Leisingera daeponensis]|uniref:Isochorismatase family protein n=1 Tax=Leisingera daeponensis TaxID=405746 RepID=A0ABS7NCW0_9RHOB|nr:isochorismatase family protein [Leisingera daeponensis]MBY6139013.1 isochorismatase family protein [Leisingera daeponensis]
MDRSTALLIVDMQQEMANVAATGRPQANPGAEETVARIAAAFRAAGLPVVHVLHDDPRPESRFRRDLPSGRPLLCAAPQDGEAVFWKSGSSGFCGTGLDSHLRDAGVSRLVIVGGVAAFCVNSTARSAANLGFDVVVAEDALIAFDLPARNGGMLDAEVVLEVTLSALHAGFGKVVRAEDVLAQLPAGAET